MKPLSVSDQNVSMDLIDYCYPGKTSISGNYFKRVFEKLTLPLRNRAHLRHYGSHEHPMLRHPSGPESSWLRKHTVRTP
jgi:hypothetical protein